jgi:hypothetical protein
MRSEQANPTDSASPSLLLLTSSATPLLLERGFFYPGKKVLLIHLKRDPPRIGVRKVQVRQAVNDSLLTSPP